MLNLSHEPPENPNGQPLPIRRTPAKGSLTATVTADKLLGTNTHFWGGRTTPCTQPTCEACDAGTPWRWHAYVSAIEFLTSTHFLFECTAAAAHEFVNFAHERGTLRGCTFRATRCNTRINARVIIETHLYTGKPTDLPPEPNLVLALARLWNIPANQITTPEAKEIQKTISVLDAQIAAKRHLLTPNPNGPRP